MMIRFEMLHPQMTHDVLGYIPTFMSWADPRPAREQIHANYGHGGGWRPYDGFTLDANNRIHHEGDPPLPPLAQAKLRDELIVYYQGSWIAIIQPDRSYEIARVD